MQNLGTWIGGLNSFDLRSPARNKRNELKLRQLNPSTQPLDANADAALPWGLWRQESVTWLERNPPVFVSGSCLGGHGHHSQVMTHCLSVWMQWSPASDPGLKSCSCAVKRRKSNTWLGNWLLHLCMPLARLDTKDESDGGAGEIERPPTQLPVAQGIAT